MSKKTILLIACDLVVFTLSTAIIIFLGIVFDHNTLGIKILTNVDKIDITTISTIILGTIMIFGLYRIKRRIDG